MTVCQADPMTRRNLSCFICAFSSPQTRRQMCSFRKFAVSPKTTMPSRRHHTRPARLIFVLILGALLAVCPFSGSSQTLNWQKEIRRYAEAQDWASALRVVDRETARVPLVRVLLFGVGGVEMPGKLPDTVSIQPILP